MNNAIYPGSFDPITIGHLDIIKRASKQFDTLYVAVMDNSSKNYMFDVKERVDLIKKCVKDIKNVKVVFDDSLTIDLAKKLKCKVIIRGVRALTDYENELALATANMKLDSSIETYLLVSKPELSFLSSSIAKEIGSYNGDISHIIPKPILNDVKKRLK